MTVGNCRRQATTSLDLHIPDAVRRRRPKGCRHTHGDHECPLRSACPCVAKDSNMWKKNLLLTAGVEIGAALRLATANVASPPDGRGLLKV
jgi:hypothetical protein